MLYDKTDSPMIFKIKSFFFYFYRWIKLQSIHFERYNIKMLVKKYLTLSLAEVIKYIHNSLGKGLV